MQRCLRHRLARLSTRPSSIFGPWCTCRCMSSSTCSSPSVLSARVAVASKLLMISSTLKLDTYHKESSESSVFMACRLSTTSLATWIRKTIPFHMLFQNGKLLISLTLLHQDADSFSLLSEPVAQEQRTNPTLNLDLADVQGHLRPLLLSTFPAGTLLLQFTLLATTIPCTTVVSWLRRLMRLGCRLFRHIGKMSPAAPRSTMTR